MASGLALIPVQSAAQLEAATAARNQAQQSRPAIKELASHVRKRWDTARDAKRDLEERMLRCLRQRNGEYDPEKQSALKAQGSSDVFINLTSVKCRAATSWLRDTLLGSGADKPWGLGATPEPTMPPEVLEGLRAALEAQLQQGLEQGMPMPSDEELRQLASQMKDTVTRQYKEEADLRVSRMERKMEDQLAEGGWRLALNEMLDDIVTFPYAVLKGPCKRRRKTLKWENGTLVPTEVIRNEWERVDPFMLYWAPWAWDIQDGFVIERHRLPADELQSLMGVPGYNDAAIRSILADWRGGSLGEWLWSDIAKAEAEGKSATDATQTEDLIDALQLWDSIPGKLLLEWGLTEKEIPDKDLNYPCEVWLVGNTVIRAVLNYDPLGRKPYYVASYEAMPGSVEGKGVTDLCRDSQDMANAAARALANNMGLSSGPQVGVNISRMPPGEDVTNMFPWKIWQFTASEIGDSRAPIEFFQPQSNAGELMAVFEKFQSRADEDTMIPRYMSGEHTPGAGRTSSGLSMLISNAGKGIKQVISNIDRNVIIPAIERLYQDNLRYSDDPELVGDVHVVARGASSLVVKEAEAIRRNEFLQLVLASPVAQQIVGMDGAAELLREQARHLTGNVDRVVPERQQISTIQAQQQQIMQLTQQLQQLSAQMGAPGAPGAPGPKGMVPGPAPANVQPDGAQVGGREGNLVSPRPNGV